MSGYRSIPTSFFRAECTTLERDLISRRIVTREQLASFQPGGAVNPAKDARGWLHYYRHLQRAHAVAGAGAGSPGGVNAGGSRAAADGTVLNALRAEPIAVALVAGGPDRPRLFVYPKSLDALLHVHALDRWLAWMTGQYAALCAALAEDPRAEIADCIPEVTEAISYTYQLLCWIVTHQGPGMPYASDDPRPVPPPHIVALEPWDVVRICQAHQQHMLRLSAMATLLTNDEDRRGDGGERLSWSSFVATLAMETGGDPVAVTKFMPLVAQLAAVRLAADARTPREREDVA